MASSLRRARDVLVDEGVRSFAAKAASAARAYAERAYWRLRGTRTLSVGGTAATFDASGRSARSLQFFRRGEAAMVEDMLAEARPDDVLWDVGAYVGFHAALVGQHVAETVAFEPVPGVAEELAANLRRNDVDATVRMHALSDDDGDVALPSSVSPRIPDGETLTRPVHTGDGLVAADEAPAPSMVKVDVEGAEADVLAGMSDALADCRVVYLELHPPTAGGPSVADFGATTDDVLEHLADAGFAVERLADRGAERHLKATRE